MSEHPTVAVNLNPDESLRWVREVMTQQRRVDEEQGALRNLYKRAKAAGENVTELRAAIRDSKKDTDEVVVGLRHRLYYLNLRHIPVDADDLFAGTTDIERPPMAHDPWEAEDRGYKAGRYKADPGDNPYEAGSELFAAWHAGHAKGSASIARQLGPDIEQATATRKRPRRKQPKLDLAAAAAD